MFADFRTATRGTGKSFKGALDYFLNDKVEGVERPTTAERVDVLELRNLATENPRHAWFEMMNTAQASEALKAAAGVRKGGRVGEKPVFTYHLAWHESERPDRAAMLDAAQSTLQLLGLQDHQALIVSHTDTAHPHVHVIVNRVNPIDGRFAGLSNSWKLLKGWAIDYSKAHGTNWHIPLEQAKDARQQRQATQRQAGFNRTAQGKPAAGVRQTDPPKKQGRAEWQGRKPAGNRNNPAEVEAAAGLKASLAAKWSAFRQFEQLKASEQQAEKARFWLDRKDQRDAIYQKYREANEAIWSAPRPKYPPRSGPAPLPDATLKALSRQRRDFEKQERSLAGRLANARQLAKGQSMFAIVRLALNAGERRRLFDQAQRKTANQGREGSGQGAKAARRPETRREQADRLKAMRAAELAKFDQVADMQRGQMVERHKVEAQSLAAMKAALSAAGKEAWAEHAARFRPGPVREGRAQPGKDRDAAMPQEPQAATQDRFGRRRDRKPRQPRQPAADRPQAAQNAAREAEAAPSAETAPKAAEPFNQATRPDGEGVTAAQRYAEQIKARWDAERQANENDRDPGRER